LNLHVHYVQKKSDILDFLSTSANVDQFSKIFMRQTSMEILHATVMETSISPELCCYTAVSNLKIQNNFQK